MYILCINSGNGDTKGYPVPEKGVVYSATKINSIGKQCGKCGSKIFYHIPSIGTSYMHSECMFDIFPDGFLTNLSEIKQIQIVQNG